ncbi:MAG: tetratricopeptide repeat-containing serine protease family protein [Phormidium sp.]
MSLGFSRFHLLPGLLATTVSAAVVFTIQPIASATKTPQEIGRFAKLVTVQVNPATPQNGSGSGLIVAKQGNTYTVLTCDHVRSATGGKNGATIRTSDGKSYRVIEEKSLGSSDWQKRPTEVDLALLTFTTDGQTNYEVATLAKADDVTEGAQIFVSGFPVTMITGMGNRDLVEGENRNFEFSPGFVSSRTNNRANGYNLRYTAVTLPGMSGGPVFDADGRVVAIHGRSDRDRVGVNEAQTSESGEVKYTGTSLGLDAKTGFNGAIPVDMFLARREQIAQSSNVVLDNSRSTDNPQQRLNNPQSGSDYAARGSIRQERGDRQGAIADYNQAVSLGSNDALTYFNRGVVRYNQGDYQGANQDYTQAISLSPNYASAYFNRGLARQLLKNFQGMLEDFEKVLSFDNTDPAAYNNRAVAKSALGDRPGAIADLTAALRLGPNLITVYTNRASLRRREGDRQGAIQDLNEVIRINPREASAYYNRGVIKKEVDDQSGALQDLQTAASLFQQQGDNNNYQRVQQKIQTIQAMPVTPPSQPAVDSNQFNQNAPETQETEDSGAL